MSALLRSAIISSIRILLWQVHTSREGVGEAELGSMAELSESLLYMDDVELEQVTDMLHELKFIREAVDRALWYEEIKTFIIYLPDDEDLDATIEPQFHKRMHWTPDMSGRMIN